MAVFTIQAPDGRKLTIEADNEASAMSGAQEWYSTIGKGDSAYKKARAKQDVVAKKTSDFSTQVLRNIGVGDELQGGIAALTQGADNLLRRATGREVEVPMATAYRAGADASKAAQAGYAENKPFRNALATGAGFVVGGAPSRGAAVALSPLRAGATVAATNAPFALARQDGSIGERLPGAALETGLAFGTGAALTAGANAIGRRVAAKAAAPPTKARMLSNEGVTLTPGQMMGGLAKRAEDVMTSAPITGASINARRLEGLEDLNRAAYNRALGPIGKSVSSSDPAGRIGVAGVQREIGKAYGDALKGVRVAADAQLVDDLARIEATPNLTDAQRQALRSTIGDIKSRFSGAIDGDLWKTIHADLNADIRGLQGDRLLKGALRDAKTAIEGALSRSNPQAAAGVTAADEAMANFARIRAGASRVGAEEGVMTAPQMLSAVQSADKSAGKGAFAGGEALMQDLAENAKSVLPNKVPDSGSALRLSPGLGLYGAGTVFGGGLPGFTTALAADAAGGILYSRPVVSLMNSIYRSQKPALAKEALVKLGQLAAKNPTLAPAYRQAAEYLGVRPQAVGPRNALADQRESMSQ